MPEIDAQPDTRAASAPAAARSSVRRHAPMLSALLALLLHVGLASVAATTNIDAARSNDGAGLWRSGSSRARAIQLVPWDDEPPPPPELEQPRAERAPETPTPIVPAPEPPPPEPEIALGIEDGTDEPTPNWMGFREATEHHARKSEVAQPQLDPDAGASSPAPSPPPVMSESGLPLVEGPAGEPGTPGAASGVAAATSAETTSPQPSSDPASEPASELEAIAQPPAATPQANSDSPLKVDADSVVPAAATEVAQDPASELEIPESPAPQPDALSPRSSDSALHTVEPRDAAAEPLTDEQPGSEPTPRATPIEPLSSTEPAPTSVPPSPPSPPVPSGAAGEGGVAGQNATHTGAPANPQSGQASAPATAERSGNPGDKSPKQVDASALEDSTEVRPGRPIAAKGLEITTRRPQFSKVTRVVAYPENPVLEAKFVRDGTVRSVRILKSSGFPDVDQPVIDAVFAWTAKGEALRKLPVVSRSQLASAPNAPSTLGIGEADEPGIVIKFTIILR